MQYWIQRTLLTLILLGSCRAIARAQTPPGELLGRVTYGYYPDSAATFAEIEALEAEDPAGNRMMIDQLRDQYYVNRTLEFQLWFTGEESLFELVPQLRLDTENRFLHNLAILETKGDRRHYLNTSTRTRLHERPALDSDTLYHLTDRYDKHPWTLTQATKTIAGYPCRQAVYAYTYTDLDDVDKTVHVTAWYAPDLPYPYGPVGYDGLPGLILELTTRWKRSQTFRATALQLEQHSTGTVPALGTPDRVTTEAVLAREAYERIEPKPSDR